jgi:hypothetical protein
MTLLEIASSDKVFDERVAKIPLKAFLEYS